MKIRTEKNWYFCRNLVNWKVVARRISENGKTFSLPGVEEDCGCSIFRNAWWFCWWWLWWWWWWWSWLLETGSTMSSSKISSDLFPARLDSLTRIRLWRLRCIRWKVCNNPERREDIERRTERQIYCAKRTSNTYIPSGTGSDFQWAWQLILQVGRTAQGERRPSLLL